MKHSMSKSLSDQSGQLETIHISTSLFDFKSCSKSCTNEVKRTAGIPSTGVSIWCHCDGIVLATVHVGYLTAGTVGVAVMYVSILTHCCHIVSCGTEASYPGHIG